MVSELMKEKEATVRVIKFGVRERTLDDLFTLVKGTTLPIDPHPINVRARAMELADIIQELLYEKTISSLAHQRLQITLWNNLLEAANSSMRACELVHQSLCNEAKILNYMK